MFISLLFLLENCRYSIIPVKKNSLSTYSGRQIDYSKGSRYSAPQNFRYYFNQSDNQVSNFNKLNFLELEACEKTTRNTFFLSESSSNIVEILETLMLIVILSVSMEQIHNLSDQIEKGPEASVMDLSYRGVLEYSKLKSLFGRREDLCLTLYNEIIESDGQNNYCSCPAALLPERNNTEFEV